MGELDTEKLKTLEKELTKIARAYFDIGRKSEVNAYLDGQAVYIFAVIWLDPCDLDDGDDKINLLDLNSEFYFSLMRKALIDIRDTLAKYKAFNIDTVSFEFTLKDIDDDDIIKAREVVFKNIWA